MKYKTVGILLTENCNAKCSMCCDSRGRVQGKTLSKGELDLILSNIRECDSITKVGVTGGEPMLYPDLVEYIFNYDYGREVKTSIKTNGFWGQNIEKAREFIERNKERLENISFSYDEFHKEYVNLQSILNIVKVANDLEINTDIVGCFIRNGMTPGDILNEMGEYAYLTEFKYQPVINTGAASMFSKEDFLKVFNLNKHEANCIGLLSPQLLINPNLDVYPCCSQVIENTILSFGNLKETTLSEIIDSILYNKVMHTIFTEGFKPFLSLLDKEKEYPTELTSPCELCAFFFHDDWFLKELSKNQYYE